MEGLEPLKAKVLREVSAVPKTGSEEVFEKAKIMKQLQRKDPKVDLMCQFFAEKANRILKEPLKEGEDSDFALMYVCASPPGYLIDLVEGIEGYLRTGKMPGEVVESLR